MVGESRARRPPLATEEERVWLEQRLSHEACYDRFAEYLDPYPFGVQSTGHQYDRNETVQGFMERHGYAAKMVKTDNPRNMWTKAQAAKVRDYEPVNPTNAYTQPKRRVSPSAGPSTSLSAASGSATSSSSSHSAPTASSSYGSGAQPPPPATTYLGILPAASPAIASRPASAPSLAARAAGAPSLAQFEMITASVPGSPSEGAVPSPAVRARPILENNLQARLAHAAAAGPSIADVFAAIARSSPASTEDFVSRAEDLARALVNKAACEPPASSDFAYSARLLLDRPLAEIPAVVAKAYSNNGGKIKTGAPSAYIELIEVADPTIINQVVASLKKLDSWLARRLVLNLEGLRGHRSVHVGMTTLGLVGRAAGAVDSESSLVGSVRDALGLSGAGQQRVTTMPALPTVVPSASSSAGPHAGATSGVTTPPLSDDSSPASYSHEDAKAVRAALGRYIAKAKPAQVCIAGGSEAPCVVVARPDGGAFSVRIPLTRLDDVALDSTLVSSSEFLEEYLFEPGLNIAFAGEIFAVSPLDVVRGAAHSIGVSPNDTYVLTLAAPGQPNTRPGQEHIWTSMHASGLKPGFLSPKIVGVQCKLLDVLPAMKRSGDGKATRAAVAGSLVGVSDLQNFEDDVARAVDDAGSGAVVFISTTSWFNKTFGLPINPLHSEAPLAVSPFRLVKIGESLVIAITTVQPNTFNYKGPLYATNVGPVSASVQALAHVVAKLAHDADFASITIAQKATFVASINKRFGDILRDLGDLAMSVFASNRGGGLARAEKLPIPYFRPSVTSANASDYQVIRLEHGGGAGYASLRNLFSLKVAGTSHIVIYGDLWVRVTARRDGAFFRVEFHPDSTFDFNSDVLTCDELDMLKDFVEAERRAGTFVYPMLMRRGPKKTPEVRGMKGSMGSNDQQHPDLLALVRYPLRAHGDDSEGPLPMPGPGAHLFALKAYAIDRIRRLEQTLAQPASPTLAHPASPTLAHPASPTLAQPALDDTLAHLAPAQPTSSSSGLAAAAADDQDQDDQDNDPFVTSLPVTRRRASASDSSPSKRRR
ncbi:hypothetical protein JCM10296v2_001059 [Rhodotorula toruloides]